ncbi:MAG: FAD-dependent oxidoreductase, partial [Polaromonas sp.]
MQRIVIVGGGAGGLALATQLGKQQQARITLVDAVRTNVWKPLLHQLAAGSYDTHAEEIEYLAQAHTNHFRFRLGQFVGVDRAAKVIELAASHDETGSEIMPAQVLDYDTLIISVGSLTNDFGTLGAAEHAIKLDTPRAARNLHNRLINACLRAQAAPRGSANPLTVAIVGGGATGVELAAELHAAARILASYGFDHIHPEKDLKIVLIEAAPRLLAQL